jgi:hypothetical protein
MSIEEIVQACGQYKDSVPNLLATSFTGTGFYELAIGSSLILQSNPKNIVELGTNKGWSAHYWGSAAGRISSKVTTYEIDHENVTFARNYLSGLPVEVVEGDIYNTFQREPIDFLFVDADHSRKMAEWYLANVFPLVHGWVAIHDIDIGDSIVNTADKGLFGEIEVIKENFSGRYIKTRDISEIVWGTRGIVHAEPDGNNSAVWMKL